jgi:hypothetical protein
MEYLSLIRAAEDIVTCQVDVQKITTLTSEQGGHWLGCYGFSAFFFGTAFCAAITCLHECVPRNPGRDAGCLELDASCACADSPTLLQPLGQSRKVIVRRSLAMMAQNCTRAVSGGVGYHCVSVMLERLTPWCRFYPLPLPRPRP